MSLRPETSFDRDINDSPPVNTETRTHLQQAPPRVRRRNRLITSCLECRRRKLKCDKSQPCANCTKISRPCVFIASGMDVNAQAKLAEVKEKMGILERSLEEDVARRSRSSLYGVPRTTSSSTLPGQDDSYSDQEEDEDTRDLDQTLIATEDAAYYDDDNNDDIVDLGIAMGKVRITERIGGLVRPRYSEELSQALNALPKPQNANPNKVPEQGPQAWLAPSQDYVAPSSSFFFAPGIEKTSLMTFLPSRALVDRLIAHYWEAVHLIAKTVHRPSFERQYAKFWMNIDARVEPRVSFQAVVFAALLSSIVSMSEADVLTDYGVDRQSLVENFKQGTEAALAKANFLRTTKIETLQAFVMYLIPLCRSEVSRAHSALTGMCIRLAECMGLHRDPTTYSNSQIEIQVRRLIWHQICFLDLRTAEGTGPRPQIRPDDYDTTMPLSIDDIDLDRAENGDESIDVNNDRPYFTDVTITRMRFECYEMHRILWNERPKLDQKRANGERRVTLTSLLSRIQSFKAAMEKTYLPILSKSVPLHVLASEIYGILTDRMYIYLLQRYLSSDRVQMPARLRQVIMSSAVLVLEHSMNIEEQPALSRWSWYVGALHQYHSALLLLNEIWCGQNDEAMEARAWRVMDFAFGVAPSNKTRQEKTRFILEDLIGKTEIYTNMKRMRAPMDMPHVGPRRLTPARQREEGEREDREREERQHSESLQSTGSGSGASGSCTGSSPSAHPTTLPPHSHLYPRHMPKTQTFSFPGAVPSVEWRSIDMPTPNRKDQPLVNSTEPYSYGGYAPNTSTAGIMPSYRSSNDGQRNGNVGAPGMGNYGNSTANSPPHALNEIEWTDIEQMFGGPEAGAGMYIPPFTFPQFSPGDLMNNSPEVHGQWPQQQVL